MPYFGPMDIHLQAMIDVQQVTRVWPVAIIDKILKPPPFGINFLEPFLMFSKYERQVPQNTSENKTM